MAQVSGWDTPDPLQPKEASDLAAKPVRRAVKVKPPPGEVAEKAPQQSSPTQPEPKKGFFGRIKDWMK